MKFVIILFLFIVTIKTQAQRDSIFDQGTYRTFIIHLPSDYNESNEYPLVFNLHGLGSNAIQQQLYSQFDAVADEEDLIVVYADAINNNWDLFGNTDVNFLSLLVDTLKERYSINECLFSTGMSQGGFLSYKLACELPQPISAIAVVTGNMLESLQSSCTGVGEVSVLHFHGTADQVVNYNGSFGVSPVEESVQWWASENNCNASPTITSLPDIDQSDGSTVEQYQYNECDDESEVVLYKITNGGHTWPGAFPVPSLGNTNQDIDASELIGEFFTSHCQASTDIADITPHNKIFIYPNPAQHSFKVESLQKTDFELIIYNALGKIIYYDPDIHEAIQINCQDWGKGFYFIQISSEIDRQTLYKIVITE